MRLSAPVYRLKRQARLLSRHENIPLHAALDRVASAEGYKSWSLLAEQLSAISPAAKVFGKLDNGDLVLVAARPGQGKTLFSLELAIAAMKAGRPGFFFSLEYTEREMIERFHALRVEPVSFDALFRFDCSDAISASHIIAAMGDAPAGTLAVVDYLQLLDQKRDTPPLMEQVRSLKRFAEARGLILVFVSQIDRQYDPATRVLPDLEDIRLPNPLDLRLFSKVCFLNAGEVAFRGLN